MTVLEVLEGYYDAVPRTSATTEEVGPFTLFLQRSADGWPFYARPRVGLDTPVTVEDVRAVLARQRDLGVPEALEWVAATTPTLAAAAREAGLVVHECPLLVLDRLVPPAATAPIRVEVLEADPDTVAAVAAAVSAGFAGTDTVEVRDRGFQVEQVRSGATVMGGAFDESGAVGGGAHSPRGSTTELAGIAVLPRVRRRGVGAALTHALVEDAHRRGAGTVFLSAQDEAVARVYRRLGFVDVGTACIAGPAGG